MKITRKQLAGIMLLGVTATCGCKTNYAPPAITRPNNYLVVEGVIVSGAQDSTIINISRTVNVSTQSTHSPENKAAVTVEGDQGVSYGLTEADSGRYVAAPRILDNSHKYRLKIVTADGQTYVSDYVPVKVTPPIDSVYYKIQSSTINYFNNIQSSGLEIYADTHDPANNTHYYRWDYTETYIFQTNKETDYIFDTTNPDTLKWARRRTPAEQIHTCYITINSSTIKVNTSASLSHDVIADNVITQIPSTSEKVLHRYSINVKQYALTPEAYNFWAMLKKNTQQIGTVFDAQPSASTTNLRCTSNPSRVVLGFVSASTISQKRIFIDVSQLPYWPSNTDLVCAPDYECWPRYKGAPLADRLKFGEAVPIDTVRTGCPYFFDYPTYSVPVQDHICVDCTTHLNGKTLKPSFWK
ncbi:MAG: DUF4249 domain-containing protein [Mucilaginibacter sp.]